MPTGVISYLIVLISLYLGVQQPVATGPVTENIAAPPATQTVSVAPLSGEDGTSLAKCLSGKGAKLYGAYWCSHCAAQKNLFADTLKDLNYVECDAGGTGGNPQACIDAGIEAYPTWQMPGADPLVGTQSLEKLAAWSGCPSTL
jgi:hypothetical protein